MSALTPFQKALKDFKLAKEVDAIQQFDSSSRYGPRSGLTRLSRWQRAERMGLKPPQDVYLLITADGGKKGAERYNFG